MFADARQVRTVDLGNLLVIGCGPAQRYIRHQIELCYSTGRDNPLACVFCFRLNGEGTFVIDQLHGNSHYLQREGPVVLDYDRTRDTLMFCSVAVSSGPLKSVRQGHLKIGLKRSGLLAFHRTWCVEDKIRYSISVLATDVM